MALATPVVLYGVNGGALAALVPGTPVTVATGVLLQLELQSTAGVAACTYTISGPGTTLDGQSFPASSPAFSIVQQLPITPTTYTIRCSVTDGENVTSTTVTLLCTSAGISVSPAPLNGQALISNGAGTYVPGGMVTAINVLQTGAKDDTFATDNWAFIQNAIDAPGHDTMLFAVTSTGLYGITKPLFFSPANTTGITKLQGKNGHLPGGSTNLTGLVALKSGVAHNVPSYVGPLVALTAIGDPPFNLHGAINTAVFRTNVGLGPTMINLHETGQGTINGVANFTFECFLFVPSANVSPGNHYTIAFSYGNLYSGAAQNQAFELNLDTTAGNHLGWGLTTSVGGLHSGVGSAVFPLDTLVHVALSYDGAHIRTFIAGVQDVSSAATGTVVQNQYEDFCIGFRWLLYPRFGTGAVTVDAIEFGSIRMTKSAVYTGSFTAPTAELSSIPSVTFGLWNFGAANRSTTLTATPNNPSGHQGFIVSTCNFLPISGGTVSTDTPVWNGWQGNLGSGARTNVEINDLLFQGFNDGIYISACQDNYIQRCTFNGCQRCVTTSNFGYNLTIRDCAFQTGGPDGIGYCWALGVFSEMVSVEHCYGNGGQWAVVAASTGNSLQMSHCYFDSGNVGLLLINGCYSSTFLHCTFFQEFQSVSETLLYLINPMTFRYVGGAIDSMGLTQPTVKLAMAVPTSASPANTTASVLFDTWLTNFNQTFPLLSFAGSSWLNPVEFRGFLPDIESGLDPGTSSTPFLDSVGIGPVVFPHKENAIWTTAMPDSNLSYPGNNFFPGTWVFTGALTADRTVTIPYNMRGARKRVRNTTTGGHNLLFVGTDGGTPITVGNGKTAEIYCTDTYVGTGAHSDDTWVRGTADI